MSLSQRKSDKQLQTLREEMGRVHADLNRSRRLQQVFTVTPTCLAVTIRILRLCICNQDTERAKARQSDSVREVEKNPAVDNLVFLSDAWRFDCV